MLRQNERKKNMEFTAILQNIVLPLLLGLAFFLFGMHVMSGNLEKMAGGRMEQLMQKVTANPLISMALGAGITIAIQSSSASTVMLVGLVNSGIMKFSQTLSVIFGANIGTTLTAWLLALTGIESDNLFLLMLKPANFSPILAIIGIGLIMMAKGDHRKSVGSIFVGFAVLMYGMEIMSDAAGHLTDVPGFSDLLVKFTNPIIALLVGTLFTALIQSSAASVGILQALSLTGKVTYGMAIPIVMGQNIGTCVTALISSIGTSVNARRVAILHLSINVIGTMVCMATYLTLDAFLNFAFLSASLNPAHVALIHTVFNLTITALLMPFSKWSIRLAEVLVPEKTDAKTAKKEQVFKMDDLLLRSPSVAVKECDKYTVKMMEIANHAVTNAIALTRSYDEKLVAEIREDEHQLDQLEDSIGTYLVKLSARSLSREDSQRISKMLHALGDFERMGDHAMNLSDVAIELHEKKISFSEQAMQEINVLADAVREIMDLTMEAYRNNDISIAAQVEPLEEVIDGLNSAIKDSHINRLQHGDCTMEMGFILADLLQNFERISDHCSNVAVAVIELVHNSFDTHKYLNNVKFGNSEFTHAYEGYSQKYRL